MNLYSSCREESNWIKNMLIKAKTNPVFANLIYNSNNTYKNYLNKYNTSDDFVNYSKVGNTSNEHIFITYLNDLAKILSVPASELNLQKKKFLLQKLSNEYSSAIDRMITAYERGVRYVS